MLTLWKSLVRPRLEYCCNCVTLQKKRTSPCWKHHKGPIQQIYGLQHLNYWERLHRLSTCASSKGLQALIHHSFSHNGVRLFNCAPRHIRDLTGVTTDTFKHHLDKWLADIPDQPPTQGYSSSHDNTLPSVVLEARNRELHTTPGMSGGPPQLPR
ncbi:hypothetical protein GWK47_021397 [Chionoecetes opilio]|uniref:Uncharacterized protein n=1 Tax=Chionoecetes opilio TaxID=41210 RepID=A0A8J5CHX1_CHIOP|nr:hypothetical protein GWK47_021397 [Chionoecetes opilio]